MSRKLQRKQKGFTLVELSIVLVIIGLIISSVLVGQDLVRSAELRAVVTQYESFNAAVGTFRGKYEGMPGDLRGEADYGFVGNGDGDTLLGTSTDLTAATTATPANDNGENVSFWNHLGSTGAAMIPGSYDGAAVAVATTSDTLPSSKVGEFWGVFSDGSSNYFMLGVRGGGAGIYLTADVLNPLDARNIDTKIDDGQPRRGVVHARDGHATDADTLPSYNATAGNATACVTGATNNTTVTYNTQNESVVCTLRIRFNL